MYLRLKARRGDAPSLTTPGSPAPATATELRAALQRDHYAAFDWRHGGPPGPIKFIDCHQLALAGRQALMGDDLAVLLLRRYLHGIQRLLGHDGGAAQYASGFAWDTPCRSRTLAGQAAAIQAFVIAGRLGRSHSHYRCVAGISAFATARWCAPVARWSGASPFATPAVLRDRAWYASALLAFAQVYDAETFYRRAWIHFSLLESRLRTQSPGPAAPDPLGLDEAIAIAAAARDFGIVEGQPEYLRLARDLIVDAAARYRHPEGGWYRPGDDGTPLDIDATIDLVRVADSLQALKSPPLERISETGKRALFTPLTALARRPESGLLLLDPNNCTTGCRDAVGQTSSHVGRTRLSA